MKHKYNLLSTFIIGTVLLLSNESYSQNSVTLRRSFVDSIKNVVGISGKYWVDVAHARPNRPVNDGDMHIAGRNKQVGLPIVAEIMNATDNTEAVDLIHNVEGTDNSIELTGVWRLWFEHPHGAQVQKEIKKRFTTTNPDHIFEIHPITSIDNIDLIQTLKPIDGYAPKDAATAFNAYSKAECTISTDGDNVFIEAKKIGYNYVEFNIVIGSAIDRVSDGSLIFADVYTKRNKRITENIRMVFPKGSEAETELKKLSTGDKMHLLGIPRVNLDEIVKNLPEDNSSATISLPFEIIIVGAY